MHTELKGKNFPKYATRNNEQEGKSFNFFFRYKELAITFIDHFCCFFFLTISQVTIISGRRALVLSAEPGVFEELFLQERKAERANERKESCKCHYLILSLLNMLFKETQLRSCAVEKGIIHKQTTYHG